MHDCQATKARLIDLVFGEAADAETLRAQVRSCDGCAAEYRTLSDTLRAFDRAADEAQPPEEFWPQYHARLAQRLAAAESGAVLTSTAGTKAFITSAGHMRARLSSPVPWLRRALTARWSVPAPAAVAALLLLACLTPLALRSAPPAVAPSSRKNEPAPAANEPPPVRTVEVPVVREKIVTRTVYVARPARKVTRATRTNDARLASESSPVVGKPATGRDTLTGFQPAGDVRLRVIKGSFENER
jgi:hypothetical protein